MFETGERDVLPTIHYRIAVGGVERDRYWSASHTPLFDTTQQVRLSSASPKDKEVLGLNWKYHGFTANLNTTRYGEVKTVAFTSLTPAQIAVVTKGYQVELRPTDLPSANSQVVQVFGAEFVSDLTLSYSMGRATFTLGVKGVAYIRTARIYTTINGPNGWITTTARLNALNLPYLHILPQVAPLLDELGRPVATFLDKDV